MGTSANRDDSVLPPYTETSSPVDQTDSEQNLNSSPFVTNSLKPFNSGLSSNQIKTALLKYTTNSYLSSTSKIKEIKFLNVEYTFVHLYKLQTYKQHREQREVFFQYAEGRLEDNTLGEPPALWQIKHTSRPGLFEEHKEIIKVPYSECVKGCFKCKQKGKRRCPTCKGFSSPQNQCFKCDNKGKIICKVCNGNGNLKYFLEVVITWENGFDEHLQNDTQIPAKYLHKAKGFSIFEDSKENCSPVDYLSNPEISAASRTFINKSKQNTDEKILWQRQQIKVIPVAAVHYQHEGKIKTFYCYDNDLKIYASKFPSIYPKIPTSCSLM